MALEDDVPQAVNLLNRVLQGHTIERVLTPPPNQPQIPSRVKAWVYGSCRHYYSLREQLTEFITSPFQKLDVEVSGALLIGAFRLRYTTTPKQIVVSASVDGIKRLHKASASGMVNAVLRKITGDFNPKSDVARFELPRWLLHVLQREYGEDLLTNESWLAGLSKQMPHMLRINRRRTSPERFLDSLDKEQIKYSRTDQPLAIRLDQPKNTASIPGYAEGWFSTQDANAQRAVWLLNPKPGMRVLDACAAPGNKSFQILDQYPNCQLVSTDISPPRSRFAKQESRRLGVKLDIIEGDATSKTWWDGELFDRILIDAPCSAIGTVARRPDVKLHRAASQLNALVERQLALLNNLFSLLAPNGQIIYCTCSLLSLENDNVIAQFAQDRHDVAIQDPPLFPGLNPTKFRRLRFGTQLLPDLHTGDGFYFSRLEKVSTNS